MTFHPSFSRCLLSGLVTGLVTWIAATIVVYALEFAFSLAVQNFSINAILFFSIVLSLLGGKVFYFITRYATFPLRTYTFTSVVVAILLCILITVAPPYRGPFVVVGYPVIALGALISIFLLPRLALSEKSPFATLVSMARVYSSKIRD